MKYSIGFSYRAFLTMGALSALSFLGCSRVKTATSAGGVHSLQCGKGMTSCVKKAAKICGDDGYTILGGGSQRTLLGGESSAYRTMSEAAELSFHCGFVEPKEEEKAEKVVKAEPYRMPMRSDEPLPAKSASACTPGATQKCFGAGACEGGQMCGAEGKVFGPCDCGGSKAAPVKAAPVKAAPAESSLKPVDSEAETAPAAPAPLPGAAPEAVPLK